MVGLSDFRSHSKSRPFATQPLFDHSKSRLVRISDLHCVKIFLWSLLAEYLPKFLFFHLAGHVLKVFSLHGRICLEDGLDDVRRQVVLDAVGTVWKQHSLNFKPVIREYFLALSRIFDGIQYLDPPVFWFDIQWRLEYGRCSVSEWFKAVQLINDSGLKCHCKSEKSGHYNYLLWSAYANGDSSLIFVNPAKKNCCFSFFLKFFCVVCTLICFGQD